MNKLSKYEEKYVTIEKYVKICTYGKICKIKYNSFNWKSIETNLSFTKIKLSSHSTNMYLHINPSPINNLTTLETISEILFVLYF